MNPVGSAHPGRCDRSPRHGLAVTLLLLAALLWSLNGLFIKQLHATGLSGWTIAGYRSLFACLLLTAFAAPRCKRIAEPGWLLATAVSFTAMCATFVVATTLTSAANAIILQYTAPVWVFLCAPLITREHASRQQFIALLLSLLGVAVIFLGQYATDALGLIVGLASGLVFGVQSVLFRRVRAVDPLVLTWLVCGGSAVLLTPAAHLLGNVPLSGTILFWLAVMGIVQFGLPYVLYSAALKHATAQQGILLILVEAVLNPLWVWIVVHEVPHASTFVGGACILASVAYMSVIQMTRTRTIRP